ncbi:O-antigen ligase family protein [Myroides phaeus]|uniref:O-antigen ligase family protein n=1 Tax=Myroides phaeus TaxID=702745 RepID=UPI001303D4C6|nr:O-antigen ligase family protein [Myroides phaeus]
MYKKINCSISKKYLFIYYLFTFLGFYASILLFASFASLETSRLLTIPIRLVLAFTLIVLFLKNIRQLHFSKMQLSFLVFSIFYIIRILIDYSNEVYYYTSYPIVLGYFISFSFLPFIILSSIKITKNDLDYIFNAFLIGGIAFSILCLVYYGKFIGQVSRLSSTTADEDTLSPLALSYCSSLIIGVFSFYLLHNSVEWKKKFIMISCILLSFVPFFLGASRGSLMTLIGVFIFYILVGKGAKFFLKSLVILVFFVVGIVFLDNYLGSGLLDRFLSTSEQIDSGASGAIRIVIWENAFNQFLDNPFFGDSLRVVGWRGYAHNLFIEVLQTTGLFGFIPLFILIYYVFKVCFYIGKNNKEYFWVVAIFIQSFVQQLFSGAIYTASWMWSSMGLVLVLYSFLKKDVR